MATFLRTRTGVALVIFLAIGAFFLVTEHTAHVFRALPFLLLLACPLLHFFMHGGHGGHGAHEGEHTGHAADAQRSPRGGQR